MKKKILMASTAVAFVIASFAFTENATSKSCCDGVRCSKQCAPKCVCTTNCTSSADCKCGGKCCK